MIEKIKKLYPNAGAIYDAGKHYAIVEGDTVLFIDKQSLEVVKAIPTYLRDLPQMIELWPLDDDDDEDDDGGDDDIFDPDEYDLF